jgi:hypothetical protein
MNTSALIMYLGANITVAAFTAYYFYKVLTTPSQQHEDED